GLLADASEGLEVPAYVPPPEPVGRAVPASQARSASEEPGSEEMLHLQTAVSDKPEARELSKSEIRATQRKYPWLFQIFGFDEITPELIAAREAVGVPFPRQMLDNLYGWGYLPRPDAADRTHDIDVNDLLDA